MKIEINVEVDASLLKYDTETLYKNVQKELKTLQRHVKKQMLK